MKKRTRLRITLGILIFMGAITVMSVLKEMEGLASACVGNIMIIGGIYMWGETTRPSLKETK